MRRPVTYGNWRTVRAWPRKVRQDLGHLLSFEEPTPRRGLLQERHARPVQESPLLHGEVEGASLPQVGVTEPITRLLSCPASY